MAILYPPTGAINYGQFAPTSVQAIHDALKNFLIACGWTSTSIGQKGTLTLGINPTNGQTTTLGAITYRYVTTLAGCAANDVLIGATVALTANNLNDAINGSPGSGTEWCASTVANASVTSTVASNVLTLAAPATGFSANSSFVVSGQGTYVSQFGNGYIMAMLPTPAFLTCSVLLEAIAGNTTSARIRLATPDLTFFSGTNTSSGAEGVGTWWIAVNGGITLEFCGCAHQFMTFLLADAGATIGVCFFMSVGAIRLHNTGTQITGATNATPVVITAVNHGLIAGQDVYITGVGGNGGANGFFSNIGVVDADHITLTGSVGTGGYTTGGVLGGPQQISRLMFAYGTRASAGRSGFRIESTADGGHPQDYFVCVNQYTYSAVNGTSFSLCIPNVTYGLAGSGSTPTYSFGGIPNLAEPYVAWGLSSPGGSYFKYMQLWACFIMAESMPMDRPNTGFDGHDWFNLLNNDTNRNVSLWFAKN